MQKIVLIVGVILLMLGVFVLISANNIMSEISSVKNSYDPIHYFEQPYHDTVVRYEQGLHNIWNAASPFGMIGIVVLLIGVILTGFSFVLPIEKRVVRGHYEDD